MARAANEEVLELEYRFRTADGRWIWCLSRHSVFARDERGQPHEVIGSFLDITQRKEAEQALRESEERFRLASVATNDAFWDFDLATGRVSWNENYSRLYARPPDTADSLEWWIEHIHPDDRERTVDSLRATIDGSDSVWVCEYRFQGSDGQWACIEDRGYVVRNASGQALRIFGAMHDLTDRKRAEEALRKSEERLRLAQSAAKVGIWNWDLASGEMEWTPELQQMFGYEAGEFPGTYEGFRDRVHPSDLPEIEAQREAATEARRDFSLDFRILLPSGQTRWINCMGAAEYDAAHRPSRLFGASVDITARKQTELELAASIRDLRKAQEQLMHRERLAMLEHLAGRVAHEVRTPLAVIQNGVYYLRQHLGDKNASIAEALAESSRAVANVDHIITEMLEFVRKPSPATSVFPVSQAIAQALERIHLPDTVKLRAPDGESSRIKVCANPEQLIRILVALLENAVQAMPEGGELEVGSAREQDGRVCIQVSDTGVGIPEEDLERVFEPLFSSKTTGIGLGLSIAKRLAQLNGGALTVQSQAGRGSTFRLTLDPGKPPT